jgi:hypothetical protein
MFLFIEKLFRPDKKTELLNATQEVETYFVWAGDKVT